MSTSAQWRTLALFAMCALLATSCSDRDESKTSVANGIVSLGTVGELAPTPAEPASGPRMTLPHDLVVIPGTFDLNSTVSFDIPLRNDGDETLLIERLQPG